MGTMLGDNRGQGQIAEGATVNTEQPTLFDFQGEIGATEQERFVVWCLRGASSKKPITIAQIRSRIRGELRAIVVMSDREIKKFVRCLRYDRGLPVLARRSGKKRGYFFCESAAEMLIFAKTIQSQAEEELRMLRKMVRLNYPELLKELNLGGGYEEFDFEEE